jgi:hypothetical protein
MRAVLVPICRIFRVLVSRGECAQELADGIETFGQSLRSKCSQETSDFGSGLGHLGFRSAVANVSKFFLMCGGAAVSEANVATKRAILVRVWGI